MQPIVIAAIKRLLTARAEGLASLTLSWFGGEPLLARDIVEDIQQHALGLVDRYPEMSFDAGMTTNGYFLTPEVLTGLVELGVISYQITIDGARETHDRRRIQANGQGTFDRIWQNLLETRAVMKRFDILVRLHIDQDSVDEADEMIRRFEDAFGCDRRYRLFIRPIAKLRDGNDRRVSGPGTKEWAWLRQRIEKNGRHMIMRGGHRGQIAVCYASMANSFVVRADGRLNKCTVSLEEEANQIGKLNPDGTVGIDTPKMTPWLRGLWTQDRNTLECPRQPSGKSTGSGRKEAGHGHEEAQWHL
jgi:uncharacterized protein